MSTTSHVSIDAFLPVIAEGQPVLTVLGLTLADFTPDSFEQLLENACDVGRGVTAISRRAGTVFFGLFNQLTIKQHSDGGIDHIFTGTTRNAAAITQLVQLLYQNFGQGYHDDAQHLPFSNTSQLARLTGNQWLFTGKTLLEAWTNKYTTCSLRYSAIERHKLLLSVHQKPEPVPDKAVRGKGTVADLLRFNLAELLTRSELRKEVALQDGTLKSVAYYFQLDEPELGIFDQAQVRIFGAERASRADLPVNLTLSCSQPPTYRQLVQVFEQLIRLYGPDGNGAAELVPYEVRDLQSSGYTGRMWSMTEKHQLWQPGGQESIAYVVDLSRHRAEKVELFISGYNVLLDLFTVQ